HASNFAESALTAASPWASTSPRIASTVSRTLVSAAFTAPASIPRLRCRAIVSSSVYGVARRSSSVRATSPPRPGSHKGPLHERLLDNRRREILRPGSSNTSTAQTRVVRGGVPKLAAKFLVDGGRRPFP